MRARATRGKMTRIQRQVPRDTLEFPTRRNVVERGRENRRAISESRKSRRGGNGRAALSRNPCPASTQPLTRKNLSGMLNRNVWKQAGCSRDAPPVRPGRFREKKLGAHEFRARANEPDSKERRLFNAALTQVRGAKIANTGEKLVRASNANAYEKHRHAARGP